jgi:hypothetical protein
VFDDEDRIVYSGFTGRSRTVGPKFEAILLKLKECMASETCIDPKLDADQKSFLNDNLAYNYYDHNLTSTQVSQEEKRKVLERFLNRIKRDNDVYQFYINPIARFEGNSLIIPMDVSVLGEAASKFIESIEKAWNIDNTYSVKIEAKNRPESSYLLNVDDVVGGRAFVMHSNGGSLQLFNMGRLKTATHEFGHVIGLPDEYYTTWDPSVCGYNNEYNAGNLMSDSSSGKVLPEHWQAIKKAYSKQ